MHRSGTSALAGQLAGYGLHLGKTNPPRPSNPKGNQELPLVNRINSRLMWLQGGAWHRPVEVLHVPLPYRWLIRYVRGRLSAAGRPWGIKDPRLLFCRGAWFRPGDRQVGIFRHPAAVVASLRRRHGGSSSPYDAAGREQLWVTYNRQLLRFCREQPFPLICFGGEESRYRHAVQKTAAWLNLPLGGENFFDSGLIHHRFEPAPAGAGGPDDRRPVAEEICSLHPDTVALYEELCRLAAGGG